MRPMRPFSRSISDIKAFIISPSLKTSRKERIDPFVSEDWWRSPLAPPKSIKNPYGFTAVKPYGFFIDLGGASGLLHQSSLTNGSIRSLREVFREGEIIKALISEIDLEKGRIGLNTALLENSAGELIIDKQKVMKEATERALKTKALFDKKEQDKWTSTKK